MAKVFINGQKRPRVQLLLAEKWRTALTADLQTDKRIQKTLLALREAFFELVLTYSYDEITVSDIIEKANVGRSTFYQHYKSKDEILAISMNKLLDDLALSADPADNQQVLFELLEHFWENRKFAPKIFAGTARRVVVQALADRVELKLKQRAKSELAGPTIPFNIAAHQVAEAQLIVCIDWMLGKGKSNSIDMAKYIDVSTKALCNAFLTC